MILNKTPSYIYEPEESVSLAERQEAQAALFVMF